MNRTRCIVALVAMLALTGCKSDSKPSVQSANAASAGEPQGPPGPAGPQGPAGPAGPAGAVGPVGPSSFRTLTGQGSCQYIHRAVRSDLQNDWVWYTGVAVHKRIACPNVPNTTTRMLPISGGIACGYSGAVERSVLYGDSAGLAGWEGLCMYPGPVSEADKELRRRDMVVSVLCCG